MTIKIPVKKSTVYAGTEVYFVKEVGSIDEAQGFIDAYRSLKTKVCCLHQNGKHQIYIEHKEI